MEHTSNLFELFQNLLTSTPSQCYEVINLIYYTYLWIVQQIILLQKVHNYMKIVKIKAIHVLFSEL